MSMGADDRQIRIFVSSTFRDMEEEREELVKFTFPELRKRCRERQVELVEVDLRWGVTEEQADRGEVLPICLAEIDNCRPYFIGILGERYGFVPGAIHPELIHDQPWLAEHREHSITELEILHGVLNNLSMAGLSFFYFRDPAASHAIETKLAAESGYRPQPESSTARLNRLKERIRVGGYPVQEGFSDAQSLGRLVLADLWQAIDARFPADTIPTALEQERRGHEAFAAERTRVYLGRPEYFEQLDAHARGSGPPLVLLGDSGSGKSALIANWVKEYRKQDQNALLILHCIGSTAGSADYVGLLRRIMEEIKAWLTPSGETAEVDPVVDLRPLGKESGDAIPADPKKMVEVFPFWLAKANARGRVILVLDGLNQLDDRDNAPELGWLPTYFPPNIRVLLATLPGRSLTALEKRGWPTLTVSGLTETEIETYIETYLAHYRKRLIPERVQRIAASTHTSNPLFLKTLLEELRVFGIHEKLDDRIDHYLQAESVGALFALVLDRLEADYEKDRPGLVGKVMTLLWASRRGLSEGELLELLKVPHAVWSPLHLALAGSICNRAGLLNFFHDYLRQAAERRYLFNEEERHAAHLVLADFFEGKELDRRKVDELPWQLCEAEDWQRLKDCVTDIEMFLELRTDAKQYELTGYWLAIGSLYDMVEAYNQMIARYECALPDSWGLADRLNVTGKFLYKNGRYDGAELLYRRALATIEKVWDPGLPDSFDYGVTLSELALLLRRKGDHDGAESLLRRALEISEKVLGPEHPDTAVSLDNLALLLNSKGDYGGAESINRRALAIFEKVLGTEHPDTAQSLNNLAYLLCNKGDYDGAEPLYRRALAINEKVLGTEHPDTATSLDNLALLLYNKGDYGGAESINRRALAIFEKVLGTEHPDTVLARNNLAAILQRKPDQEETLEFANSLTQRASDLLNAGELDKAEPLFRRALAIYEKVLGSEHFNTAAALNNLAGLLYHKGDYDSSEPLYRRALAIYEKVLGVDHLDTVTSLTGLGALSYAKDDFDCAELLVRRALSIRETTLGTDHIDTAMSLYVLAGLLRNKLDYDNAELLYRRTLAIREKVLGPEHPDTATSLDSLAGLLDSKGDLEGAEPLTRRALAIREKVLGPEHPDTAKSLNTLALLLQKRGEYQRAEPLFRTALAIREKALGPEHPDTASSLNDLGNLLAGKGDDNGAEPLYRRALAINEKVHGSEHPDTAQNLNNLAYLLCRRGDYYGAEPLLRRVLALFEKVLGAEHPNTVATQENLDYLLQQKIEQEYRGNAFFLTQSALDLLNAGQSDKAEPLLRRAIAIFDNVLGPDHLDLTPIIETLGKLLYNKGDYVGAELLYRRMLSISEKIHGPDHSDTARYLNNLAQILFNKRDYDGAETLFRRALTINENLLGKEHTNTIAVRKNLAFLLLRKSGRF